MPGALKALSLTQPWASLVAIGAKAIETRSWGTAYRGPIAIHASKGFPGEARDLVGVEPFRSALLYDGLGAGKLAMIDGELPLGAIVAVADLVGCWRMGAAWLASEAMGLNAIGVRVGEHEAAFGDYTPGRHAWLLHDVHALERPVPCRGALGLWDVPADVDERRFQVLDVGEDRAQDSAYFQAIRDEMDNGGREALLQTEDLDVCEACVRTSLAEMLERDGVEIDVELGEPAPDAAPTEGA